VFFLSIKFGEVNKLCVANYYFFFRVLLVTGVTSPSQGLRPRCREVLFKDCKARMSWLDGLRGFS